MPVNEAAIAALAGTGILVYSGITGKSPLTALKEIISGQSPSAAPTATPITDASYSSDSTVSGSSYTASELSQDALQWQGHAYVYGGAPGPNGLNGWDCSSFMSYVIGHDGGLQIPGGSWSQVTDNGSEHGPTTVSYLVWSGAKTISAKSAQAGDLACWQTHIGMFINNTQIVSALNPSLGTAVSTANGTVTGEILVVRRITAAG
jgi:cell wall-associated NlpC family hydrolase